ncbi:A/B/D/E cyclin [Cylindrobasidium torrendii FP15055 ss-10]|uniref:A/B/D/E cyclin n=1 Tax=Cylindrobasidium torrendii FP15055 ss-10 TaxID=1314674 RepID=A0A0D7AUP5_9AGAR|nr:A/B/D/E cyclin [Cylindrobasidium torrendii FP15055 ss-10]
MASLQPRRTLRTTRATSTNRGAENAHARPQRIAVQAKPLSSVTGPSKPPSAAGKAVLGDASKDDTAGKRKRDVLIEMPPNVPSSKAAKPGGKGKEPAKHLSGIVVPRVRPTASARSTSLARTYNHKPAPTQVTVEELPSVREDVPLRISSADDKMSIDVPFEPTVPEAVSGYQRRYVALSEQEEPDFNDVPPSKRFRTSSEAPFITEEPEEENELFDLHLHSIEADPDGDEWDDLDIDDAEDPVMVSEYVVEIFQYMKETEVEMLPNPGYMSSHKELSWRMRGTLLDWLIGVHARCRLMPETFHLTVNLLDRFMSLRVCTLSKFQLVGLTCLFIASKVEETCQCSASDLISLTDNVYNEAQMFQAERYILKSLDYNLNYPNPIHYLRRISKADDYNQYVRTLGKYLVEIGCMEWRLLATPPSLLAAASMWVARLALGFEDWTANLAHYSSYSQSNMIPTANLILSYILKPVRHDQFHRKYARKTNHKASEVMRQWALSRWPEGATVDLSEDLRQIKADIRQKRKEEELAEARAARHFSRAR